VLTLYCFLVFVNIRKSYFTDFSECNYIYYGHKDQIEAYREYPCQEVTFKYNISSLLYHFTAENTTFRAIFFYIYLKKWAFQYTIVFGLFWIGFFKL
jgi:hypothetical protein